MGDHVGILSADRLLQYLFAFFGFGLSPTHKGVITPWPLGTTWEAGLSIKIFESNLGNDQTKDHMNDGFDERKIVKVLL